MAPPTAADDDLDHLRRAAAGDANGWAVLDRHRDRLCRLVDFRLDRRLRGRVDPSDVVQEALADAARRVNEFLADPAVPVFIWLRFLARQQLATHHRHHLGRELRDAAREVPLAGPGDDSSAALVAGLAADQTGPSTAADRAERADRLHAALTAMDPTDREVLALRHFEGLSNAETAAALSLTVSAASKRYVRAVERLRAILTHLSDTPSPGGTS